MFIGLACSSQISSLHPVQNKLAISSRRAHADRTALDKRNELPVQPGQRLVSRPATCLLLSSSALDPMNVYGRALRAAKRGMRSKRDRR